MARTIHGMSNAPTYDVYYAMRHRCNNPNNPHYDNYGGRGICVCDRWATDFVSFLEDMGECPPGQTLERVDNNKGYCPENCRWASRMEQANNKRSNTLITHDGVTKCIAAWAREYAIPKSTLSRRLKRMPFKEAVLGHRYRMPNSKKYHYLNQELTLKEWCKKLNLNYSTVWYRINKAKWPFLRSIQF